MTQDNNWPPDPKRWGFYDPPEGWKYGFPKAYRPLEGESVEDTLKRDGYPESMLQFANHCRFIGR